MVVKVVKTLIFFKELIKLNFSQALEYRFNFIAQTIGMIINDIFWIFFWFLMLGSFGSINTWEFQEILIMYAVLTCGFGLAHVLFLNIHNLATMIENGELDYYLLFPKNVLLHCTSGLSYGAFGDVIFGLSLGLVVIPLYLWPLFLLLCILSALIIYSWSVLVSSITFFAGRFEAVASAAKEMLLVVGGYPFSVYSGAVRNILLFIVPAGFIAGIPVEILKEFSSVWLVRMILVTIIVCSLAVSLFYLGLRRYESGNVMAMKS